MPTHPRRVLSSLLVVGLLVGAIPALVAAQAPSAAGVTVVARGLNNPRGFTWVPDWNGDHRLYVALAGTGAPIAGGEVNGVGSDTASVVWIANGCPARVTAGLPSGGVPDLGWVVGVADLAFYQGALYLLVAGGGAVSGHPETPNGVYRLDGDRPTLIADLSAWFRANPVAAPQTPLSPDGQPVSMVAGAEALWIADANHQQVLTVTPDGAITHIADLSPLGNMAPSGITLAPDGGVYVSSLSPLPFSDGTATVVHVAVDGTVMEVWRGLTAVTSVAVGPDGALYALEMATGNRTEAPFVAPHTGRVVRQTGPDTAAAVATGLNFPVNLEVTSGGYLYVATPAFGANAGQGAIVRLDPAGGEVIAADEVEQVSSPCAPMT